MPKVAVGPWTVTMLMHSNHKEQTTSYSAMLTIVASVATLKPLPRVVNSVFGAVDGGVSINVGCTSGNASVKGTNDR